MGGLGVIVMGKTSSREEMADDLPSQALRIKEAC